MCSFKEGAYYSLDALGARIWALIQQPRTVREVRDVLLEEYDCEPDLCERGLLAFLQQLAAHELITIRGNA
ncbi:MAG: PqqD family peptide modification chaperone [Halobacteriota archaeon]